ncbi:MAG: hypothetical protein QXR26_09180, partial [Candidatus Caldarchaeum sp.]
MSYCWIDQLSIPLLGSDDGEVVTIRSPAIITLNSLVGISWDQKAGKVFPGYGMSFVSQFPCWDQLLNVMLYAASTIQLSIPLLGSGF